MANSDRRSRQIPNQDRLIALGQAVAERNGGPLPRRKRAKATGKKRVFKIIGLSTLGVVVALVLLVVADYYYIGSKIHHTNVSFLQSDSGPENILLVGSTDRCALKVQNAAYGLCQNGVNGVNSDIVMIIHLDPSTGQVALLSIPRDTFIPNARSTGANKIDAALYEGAGQLASAVEEDFGIPINHYVELNFDTFANVVDALGGVELNFPVPIFDAESGLNIKSPGCYLLDGYHALQVVRARHLQIQPNPTNHIHQQWPQEQESDIARIRRTHEFLRVLAAKVASRGLSNPFTDQSIALSVLSSLQVDQNFSEHHMISLAETFAHVKINNVEQLTYPVASVVGGSYLYKGYYYGDVVFPINPTGAAVIRKVFFVNPNQNTFNYKLLPTPSSINVTVENGTGTTAQAATIGNGLKALGFHVTGVGDRTPVGKANETVVWYGGSPPPSSGNWKSPGLAAAQAIMRKLSGPVIMGYDPAEVTPGALVTVQTGNGVSVVASITKVQPSTATQAKSTNPILEPTLPTNQPLAPYDPRACSPGQVVNTTLSH